MKPFHFSMEAIRTLRHREEQAAEAAYALALALRDQAINRLDQVEHEYAHACRDLQVERQNGCPAGSLARLCQLCCSVDERRKHCATELNNAIVAVNQARQGMLAARRQREAVDKYHDEQRLRFMRARDELSRRPDTDRCRLRRARPPRRELTHA